MKIERNNVEAFKPVSIVLESQDEVNWFHDLLSHVGGVGKERDFFKSISRGIEEKVALGDRYDKNIFGTDQALYIK